MPTKTLEIYTADQISLLNKELVPGHIAIIPDGNRRWARQKMENPADGHSQGANNLIQIVKAAKEIGIKSITFFLFSTENWNRSREEINLLMWLLQDFLDENREEMKNIGVCFNTIGNLDPLPKEALESVEKTRQLTADCQEINMIVALNYGARDEMRRAIQHIVDDSKSGKLGSSEITESLISQYVDTAPWGDPDLFIRTSGEMRISNYLLWQMAYTEIYFTKVLWPDFTPNHLLEAVLDYQNRERRWGGK
jgi:undecaprenyl diphosphate synthase